MRKLITFIMIFLLFAANKTEAKLKVVTTTTDLGDLTSGVGGDRVEIITLSKGYQNPHTVYAKPSFMAKMQNADAFVKVGLDLDMWGDTLIDGSRNEDIYLGAPGHIDASIGCEILEIPTVKLDKSQGHIHIYGNPHYWLDPLNGIKIMDNICKGLCIIDPDDANYFKQNKENYSKEIKSSLQGWLKQMEPYKGRKIVTYHNSWPNFAKRFNLDIVGYIEPKPGVPPTANDIAKLIGVMKEEQAKVIIMEPYFSDQVPKLVAEKTGAILLVLPPSVGGVEGVNTYKDLFNYNIGKFIEAFKKS
ncbi:MAG TPA: metal ABC transporter substrate-binding protein [Candidatus Eremiobacteraeota bacterium]|nr:MAG: putative periplasmic iron-binding protein precursor [bacterium ADurb.Bin363]HPZ09274.1 metal ABC transporter substrate-binding protein [Candidatus Eremiobacteraeota bacterium]